MQHELLQTNLTLVKAEGLQEKYHQIINDQKVILSKSSDVKKIRWVVGVDVSYYQEKLQEYGIAAAILWDLRSSKFMTQAVAKNIITFPYEPGFLGFRECKVMCEAIKKLPETPELIMCDGHGIIHPRRFGEAVQLGLILNIPTCGIAKNPFIGTSEWKLLKRIRGNKTAILENKEVLGYAVCLNDGLKPVFISVGYKISLNVAVEIALKTSLDHRQPEPLYLADQLSKSELIKNK
ncbi:MAG: endonuclease V [Candidatus Hermodarchaeota archaeon]